MKIVEVTPENVLEETLFCVRDTRSVAFEKKHAWFLKQLKAGLRVKIFKDLNNRIISFIEYIPAENAWRPVDAPGYMFIQCMFVHSNKEKGKGYATRMVEACEDDASRHDMLGMVVMTISGSWMTDKRLFLKNGFLEADKRWRFELMVKKINTALEARQAPSGFGVFSLLHDGKLLEDHYISPARFKNILKNELKS
ncbi:hypothetical protein ES705_33753 [subsurface metagenome]